MARELISVSSISINDLNDAVVSGTAPSNPDEGMLWLNDNVLKQYTNGTWKTVTLDISKMDEVLAETISNIKETLGNISDDGKLTFIDRQTIASNVGSIIGEMPSTSAKSMAVLPSYTALDSKGIGTFAFLRHTARDIGMDEESTFFKEMQDTYTNLVSYISSTTPKMWDITTANKDKVITLSDKDTFNGYWLNYFLAEASMSSEIDRLANIKLDEITSGSSIQDKDNVDGYGMIKTDKGDDGGRAYITMEGDNFPRFNNTGKNLFNVREFVALNSSTFYALDNSNEYEDDVLILKGVDGSIYVDYKYLIPVKPSTKYTFSSDRTTMLRLGEYNSSKAPIQPQTTSTELTAHTFTTTAQTRYVAFKFVSNSQKPMYIPNIQLEENEIRTDYEPNIDLNYPVKAKQLDTFNLVGAKGKPNRRMTSLGAFNSTGSTTLVSSKKVGDSNLVIDSGKHVETGEYLVANYTMHDSLVGGETYTITIWGDFPKGVKVYHNSTGTDGHVSAERGGDNTLNYMGNGVYQMTTKVHSNFLSASPPFIKVYQGSNGSSANLANVVMERISIVRNSNSVSNGLTRFDSDLPEGWDLREDIYEIRANSSNDSGAIFYGDENYYHPNREVSQSFRVWNIGGNGVSIASNGINGAKSQKVFPGESALITLEGTHRDTYNFSQAHFSSLVGDPKGKNYLSRSLGTEPFTLNSNNNSAYPIKKGVEGNTNWLEQYPRDFKEFIISTYVQEAYNVDSNFTSTGPYNTYLKGHAGPVTYSVDVKSPYPMTVHLRIDDANSEKVKLVPNQWTRLAYTDTRGLVNRPGSFFAERGGPNKDIPVGARLYWRNYKIEKGDLANGTANGLYAPGTEEVPGYNINFLITQHKYELGAYTPFNLPLSSVGNGELSPTIGKQLIKLHEGLRKVNDTYKDILYKDSEDNKWKIKRMTGEFKLDGTENYGYALESTWTGKSSFRFSGYPNGMNEYTSTLVSTHFKYSTTKITSSNAIGDFGRNNDSGVRGHNILMVTSHTTLAQFISWLKSENDKGTPVTIWYELQEPQIEVLSDELQEKLNNIPTFDGSSYVWTDTPLKPRMITGFKSQGFTRNQETKNNLDTKLDKDDYNPDDIVAQSVTATWDNYGDMIEGTVSQLTTYESRVETLQTLFSQTQESFNFNFNALTTTVGDNQTANDENFSKISKFIRFEGGNIILGEDGSSTYLEISKDKITFNNAGSEVAYISNQTMEITHGIFVETATIAGMRIQRIPGSNNIGFTVIQ